MLVAENSCIHIIGDQNCIQDYPQRTDPIEIDFESKNIFVRFLLVFHLLFILFRIALWPSAGEELSPWRFTCVVLILVPS